MTLGATADVNELCMLSAALTAVVKEANTLVLQRGICEEFRTLTRYAREILDEFSTKMSVIGPMEVDEMREFSDWAERAGEHLDTLAAIPYTTLH